MLFFFVKVFIILQTLFNNQHEHTRHRLYRVLRRALVFYYNFCEPPISYLKEAMIQQNFRFFSKFNTIWILVKTVITCVQ